MLKQRREWFAGQLDLDPTSSCSSTRPGPRPIWRANADVVGAGGGCAPPCRTATTRRLRSSPACAFAASWRKRPSTVRSTPPSFEEWVEKCLVPTLSKGDIVVMDNLPAPQGTAGRGTDQRRPGAELRYLPPYSPDMNPIEKAYSKLKAFCAKSPNEPSPACCAPSKPAPTSSNPPNAQITSRPADMIQVDRRPL